MYLLDPEWLITLVDSLLLYIIATRSSTSRALVTRIILNSWVWAPL